MTYALREEIFSKDVLTIEDVGNLLCMGYAEAAKKIREIKRKLQFDGKGVRLDYNGRLHVQDYLDYFNITDQSRYVKRKIEEEEREREKDESV